MTQTQFLRPHQGLESGVVFPVAKPRQGATCFCSRSFSPAKWRGGGGLIEREEHPLRPPTAHPRSQTGADPRRHEHRDRHPRLCKALQQPCTAAGPHGTALSTWSTQPLACQQHSHLTTAVVREVAAQEADVDGPSKNSPRLQHGQVEHHNGTACPQRPCKKIAARRVSTE